MILWDLLRRSRRSKSDNVNKDLEDKNSDNTSGGEGPTPVKKGLCRDGRMCQNKIVCKFQHEVINKVCRYGVECKKKEKCLFLHNTLVNSHHNVGPMHHMAAGNNKTYGGNFARDQGQAWGNGGADMNAFSGMDIGYARNYQGMLNNDNSYWNRCGNGGTNHGIQMLNYDRRNQNNMRKKLCRFGRTCEDKENCNFNHTPVERPCRYGKTCQNKETTCLFDHTKN